MITLRNKTIFQADKKSADPHFSSRRQKYSALPACANNDNNLNSFYIEKQDRLKINLS